MSLPTTGSVTLGDWVIIIKEPASPRGLPPTGQDEFTQNPRFIS